MIRRLLDGWRGETNAHRYSLVALLAIGTGVRLFFLFQPMMQDEAANYMYFAAKPLSYGLSHYPEPSNHLLNTFLMHWVTRVFGNAVWAIRLPAFISGILLIPVAYLLIRRLYNKNAALLATALVVVAPQLIAYSDDARGYSLQALIFALLLLTAIWLMRSPSVRGWIWFIVLSALGFYAVPTMLYFFAAAVLWMLLSIVFKDVRQKTWSFIAALAGSCAAVVLIVFLLYLPIIVVSGLSSVTSNTWVSSRTWSAFGSGLWRVLKQYSAGWNDGIPMVIAILLALGMIVSVVFQKKIGRTKVSLFYPAVVAGFGLIVIQRVLPPSRVWLPLLPVYLGLSAAGFVFTGEKVGELLEKKRKLDVRPYLFPVVVCVLALLLGAVVVTSRAPYQPNDQVRLRDAEKIVEYLQTRLKSGDIVYSEANIRKPLEYYFIRHGIPLSYLYIYELGNTPYKNRKRAFIVAAPGEGYPLQKTLDGSNLQHGKNLHLVKVAEFSHSVVYLLENPPLD